MPDTRHPPHEASPPKPDWGLTRREREVAALRAAGLKPRRRWPWVVLALAVLTGAGLVMSGVLTMPAPPEPDATVASTEPPPEAPAEVAIQINPDEVTVLAPQLLERRVRVIGSMVPARSADLSSQTSGLVESVGPRPGDRVAAGDSLVQIDVERLTLELDLAKSNAEAQAVQLQLAEAQLARVRQLVDRGVATASTLEEAQSSVDGLRASVAATRDQIRVAELSLRNADVTAPFDGIVAARMVEPGTVIAAGTPLMTIVDLSSVELQAAAPISSGPLIAPGQAVRVSVDGIADRVFEGTVARIAPVTAEGTRSLPVFVTLENPDGTLLGGMFATGEIVVASAADAIAVPTAALREDQGGLSVLVLTGDRAERRAVTIGEVWDGGLTRITDGLSAGDEVVTAQLQGLDPGDTVQRVDR